MGGIANINLCLVYITQHKVRNILVARCASANIICGLTAAAAKYVTCGHIVKHSILCTNGTGIDGYCGFTCTGKVFICPKVKIG